MAGLLGVNVKPRDKMIGLPNGISCPAQAFS